jgi:hypothetical protein
MGELDRARDRTGQREASPIHDRVLLFCAVQAPALTTATHGFGHSNGRDTGRFPVHVATSVIASGRAAPARITSDTVGTPFD